MTPYDFVNEFLALNIPLTYKEWSGLKKIFEKLSPGITADAEKPCGTDYDCHYRKAIIHDSRCPKFRTA